MQILQREKIPLGGFQGVRERRLVADQRVLADGAPGSWQGLGNFVYMADARFVPGGETAMHSHHEIDVISVMLEGRITHAGSLQHGQSLEAYDVQVQRAGGEGFSHNEINPDDVENRMMQLWVLPERAGEPASYRVFRPESGRVTRIYGGAGGDSETLSAKTCIDIARLEEGQSLDIDKPAMVYLCEGRCFANEETAVEGDLMRDEQFTLDAAEDSTLLIIHEQEN